MVTVERMLCGQVTLQASVAGEALPDLLRFWFDEGYRRLAGWHRARLEAAPALPAEAIRRSIPCGPPGAAWAFVKTERHVEGRLKSSARVYSPRSIAWFLAEQANPPLRATLGTAVLDDRGYPDDRPVRFELYRDEEEPDWCRVTFEAPERELADPGTSRVWRKFLRTAADMADPSFGLIDYQYGHYGKTATEGTVGPPWLGSDEADVSSRDFLRGYGWVTILARELAGRLGGVGELRRSRAFCEVEPLSRGGVWCLATDSYQDFDDEALLRVFLAVAPVLRPGTPRHFNQPGTIPFRVIYRDAADPYNPTPPPPEPINVAKGQLVPGWVRGSNPPHG